MGEKVLPDLPLNPTLEECQQTYTKNPGCLSQVATEAEE